jgi:hypothetical protein
VCIPEECSSESEAVECSYPTGLGTEECSYPTGFGENSDSEIHENCKENDHGNSSINIRDLNICVTDNLKCTNKKRGVRGTATSWLNKRKNNVLLE